MSSRDPNSNRPTSDDIESQRLDLAFERIRHLRREILSPEQWDSLNSNNSRNRLGPGHEAIVLTGQDERDSPDEGERMDRIRTMIPPDTRERLRQFEARRVDADRERLERERNNRAHSYLLHAAAAHMHPLDTSVSPSSSRSSSVQSPLHFASPLSPPRQRLLPYRPLDYDTPPFRRRESMSSLSDDPNTELGRRVAARESTQDSARDSSHSSNTTSSRDSHSRLPTVMERQYEYGLRTRPQRSEPALLRYNDPSLEQLRLEVESRISRSLDNPGAPPSPSAEASILRANLRARAGPTRQNSSVSSSLPSAASSQSRLSLLSNFGVQNFPTPSSTLSNPPLLFEEPTSYVHPTADESRLGFIEEERAQENSASRDRAGFGWDPRAEQDLLFTSSPVQMQHDADAIRPGHHRDNTVRVQNHTSPSLPAFDPYSPRDRDVYRGNRRMRQYVENSVMMMRRNATDQSHYNLNNLNAGFPRPEEVPRPTSMGVDPPNQLVIESHVLPEYHLIRNRHRETDDVLYYSVDPDGVSSARRYVPSSSAAGGGEEEEDTIRYFGTNVPRYVDPLPSALVDKILPEEPRPRSRRPYHANRSSTAAVMTVFAGR
ncbi:hypothetical protein FB446DRAFT_415511 [Lentinula raphanica]|nr:hypothetical protein FB446DRAFT_415511 [Lentinula raphanica]